MPGPSDIRVNPFNNATNYVNLTERHIVPSVSPFVVRLNEVPEKQDPSNMQMFYVDDTTGQTTETALTEVAATPGAGEFRPDYSTNAFDDTSWNTGLIEFSSADAGKIIEVSYTATGTLASVKSNRYPAWWLDRGDGSDGDFAPEADTSIGGEKNYRNVFIKAGITVTTTDELIIKADTVVIAGTLSGEGARGGNAGKHGGASGGAGIGAGAGSGGKGGSVTNVGDAGENGTGGGYGGAGGSNYTSGGAGGASGGAIGIQYGGSGAGGGGGSGGDKEGWGGGGGGAGGRLIAIIANEIVVTNTGKISTNGGAGGSASSRYTGGGGGGGGGDLCLIGNMVKVDGNLSSAGGTGGGASGADGAQRIVSLGDR